MITVTRSYDPEVFKAATECYREHVPEDFPFAEWLADERNMMYVSGDSVGLATYEYPGMYNAHWFFKAKGKEALDIAFAMYDELFKVAKIVRGITPIELRGARFLAKRIGFISLGVVETLDGPQEVMCLSKDDFQRKRLERYGS